MELANSQSCFIKQVVEWGEIVFGCEFANRYLIYTRSNQGPTTMLFACQEVSGYCERNYLKSYARPFTMDVKHVSGNDFFGGMGENGNRFAVFDKNYSVSCLCYCRPELKGYLKDLTGPYTGRIEKPLTYYDPVFKVYDKQDLVRFSITTSCCQCGMMCADSCGCFEPVIFLIFNGDYCNSDSPDQAVGKIIKQAMGFQAMISDADNFQVVFPLDATPEEKFNLLGAALLIDYCHFELSGRRGGGHRGHRGW